MDERTNGKHILLGRRGEYHRNLSQWQMEVYRMSKPNFQTMSQKDLQNYVLAHREDQEAFYAYVDKLHDEGNWIEMPPLESVQDLENYPDFIERFRKDSEPRDKHDS
jgi:hypothetical protein